jgi:chromosome segregation ATPase
VDPRLKEATQLEKESRELELRLREEYVEIGRRLGSSPPERAAQQAIAGHLEKLKDLQQKHDDIRAEAEKLLKTLADLEATDQQLTELRQQLEKTTQEFETGAKALGGIAAKTYEGLENRVPYEPYFEPVLKADKEIARLEKELTTLETEEKTKGFFGKLVSKGKSLSLRSAVSKQAESKESSYARLAKMLLDTDFARHLTGDARSAFDAVKRQRDEIVGLQKRISELTVAQEDRRLVLRRLCGEADPRDRGKDYEKKLAESQIELDTVYHAAAEALVGDKSFKPGDSALAGRINYVHSLRAAINDRRQRIAVLRGQLEVEELASREKALRRKREQIESEIKVRQEQVVTIDAEIEKARRRIDELKDFLK